MTYNFTKSVYIYLMPHQQRIKYLQLMVLSPHEYNFFVFAFESLQHPCSVAGFAVHVQEAT